MFSFIPITDKNLDLDEWLLAAQDFKELRLQLGRRTSAEFLSQQFAAAAEDANCLRAIAHLHMDTHELLIRRFAKRLEIDYLA